ncbi:hypothetical protein AB0K18_38200 [Nonomuraea sp. NPDC049421]|uniref:hypothetical protein n=1 Tax=Nonomuraea sp. NPDC049421 TaxID=3155275 RepID=UPI0034122A96
MNVRTERGRFRMLNGSSARMYHLTFADDRAFHVVGGDAGLLAAPVEVDRISLTPGERVELVVAFAPGEQVMLRMVSESDDIDEGDHDLVKIVAAPSLSASPPLPARLSGAPAPIVVPPQATVRFFHQF